MKGILFFLTSVAAMSSTYAAEKKSDLIDLKLDFHLACELSKLKQSLLASPDFKNEKILVAFRIAEMATAGIKTWEVKKTYEGLAMANKESKNDGWHKTAAVLGLKSWRCPSISQL